MIKASELIIREDGAVYHIGLRPDEMADRVIVVGDPSRVELVASFFDEILLRRQVREFNSALGVYGDKRVLVISSGISSDNVEILLNELDALVNIDFATREIKEKLTKLTIVRIGTCGGVSDDVALGDFVASRYAIGGETTLNFYRDSHRVRIAGAEKAFVAQMDWDTNELGTPYCVEASPSLLQRMGKGSKEGITYCAGGFYAAQGRRLRLDPLIESLPERASGFSYNGVPLLNIEMEGAAVVGLSRLLGHEALTICVIVAHRRAMEVNIDYNARMKELVKHVLDNI